MICGFKLLAFRELRAAWLSLTIIFSIGIFFSANAQKPEMILIKGGRYTPGNPKGDDDEYPSRSTGVKTFLLSKTEVTNQQFALFLNAVKPQQEELSKWIDLNGSWEKENCRIYKENNEYKVEKTYENYPVNFVSWLGADAFCRFYGGRLPFEAEWEYAARGGRLSKCKSLYRSHCERFMSYSGSNKIDEVAVYSENSNMQVWQVAQKKPNSLGLYDMSGNLSEWCADWYKPDAYKQNRFFGIKIFEKGDFKVHRGGSWYNTPDMLHICNRRASKPTTFNVLRGFRMAMDL